MALLMEDVWDRKLANQAAIIDQMKKLGGVHLDPNKPTTGFQNPPERPDGKS